MGQRGGQKRYCTAQSINAPSLFSPSHTRGSPTQHRSTMVWRYFPSWFAKSYRLLSHYSVTTLRPPDHLTYSSWICVMGWEGGLEEWNCDEETKKPNHARLVVVAEMWNAINFYTNNERTQVMKLIHVV